MFFGRQNELRLLHENYRSSKSELVVIYGRRRIGKTSLVREFMKGKNAFAFGRIEGERSAFQISNFVRTSIDAAADPYDGERGLNTWDKTFAYFTDKIIPPVHDGRKVIVFWTKSNVVCSTNWSTNGEDFNDEYLLIAERCRRGVMIFLKKNI